MRYIAKLKAKKGVYPLNIEVLISASDRNDAKLKGSQTKFQHLYTLENIIEVK
jgi:hypothetical protein